MKKAVLILNIALCLFACKKDTINQKVVSNSPQSVTGTENPNLIGVWVQDSLSNPNGFPAIIYDLTPSGNSWERVYDTLYITSVSLNESGWQAYSIVNPTLQPAPDYEATTQYFYACKWQSNNDSMTCVYNIQSPYTDWYSYQYSFVRAVLQITPSYFYNNANSISSYGHLVNGGIKFWYHKI